jgi:hypothetical protein
VQRVARSLILPTGLCGIAGCFYSGFLSYGANAMALVFGSEAADAILAPRTFGSIHNSDVVGRWLKAAVGYPLAAFGQLFPFFPRLRSPANIPYYLGLPLIGPALVLWRTRYGDVGFSMLIPIVSFLFIAKPLLTFAVFLRPSQPRCPLASNARLRIRNPSLSLSPLRRTL